MSVQLEQLRQQNVKLERQSKDLVRQCNMALTRAVAFGQSMLFMSQMLTDTEDNQQVKQLMSKAIEQYLKATTPIK